ncbi:hypothetical protein LQG66_27275 [Bradyrhizobium ontarionense]|uniref:Uncharacterized protein n=1 Tax=Bradyrhizobium ontarionense TaxID=2898149 RepID=A0ABY3R817_9BRAD|nr:hypothetical protein [Bradyrhizobium sp. A19]UFZ02932.1 hypothetical protein LQG66_27275 [Bradyrhizobium sp. A19]
MKPRSKMGADDRARISILTTARMADPAVRARISERTKAGMAAASGTVADLRLLRDAWGRARPEARARFLTEIFAPACSEERE